MPAPASAAGRRSAAARAAGDVRGLSPMLATLGDLPHGDGWSYEIKWDGVRALATLAREGRHTRLRLVTRNGNDVTARYPELSDLEHGVAAGDLPLVLDGEIVAFDEHARPDFGALQHRMHLTDLDRAAALAAERPVTFAIFDLLVEAGESLLALPWEQRRARLEALDLISQHASVPAVYRDGDALLEQMIERGMEGVVAKRRQSAYRPGKRGRDWIKVKPKPRQEFVIGGWTEGGGRRTGTVGALLLGFYDDDELVYVGNVGSGFDDRDLSELDDALGRIAADDSPFDGPVTGRHVHFVLPRLVAEIEYGEFTADGHLRHPVYKGLRDDKPAADVTLERKS